MNNSALIKWVLSNEYQLEDGDYVQTYNSVRHWATIDGNSIRLHSYYEGTAGETPIADTGFVSDNTADFLNGILAKSKGLRWVN